MFRQLRKCSNSAAKQLQKKYDAVIIGGGHNGLTAAAYLAKAGKSVAVLERRHLIGGAAVTEEIVPGFHFSRCSYVLSLLRPTVIEELELKKHGLRYHIRNPSSFTPIRNSDKSLLLGLDMKENQKEIAKFSQKDAEVCRDSFLSSNSPIQNYPKYEHFMTEIVKAVEPLMDEAPPELIPGQLMKMRRELGKIYRILKPLGMKNALPFYELMTAPIAKVMDRWFETDCLKATLGTDGVIGFSASPYDVGTGYVLLHHVIGGLDGKTGTWGYVFGGMGAVSKAIANAAQSHGANIFTEKEVDSILIADGQAKGVKLANGTEIEAEMVFSNATPKITFLGLLKENELPADFRQQVQAIDYTSPVTKINVAVKELPNFISRRHEGAGPAPHHQTTIHINSESMQMLHEGVIDYMNGQWSRRPVIEMTIPSSVDRTIVQRDGDHVVLLFTQYTPYQLKDGPWDEEMKKKYAQHVFSQIDEYAPNFSKSVVGYEVLPPPDLERIFGVTGGNIFHGSMSLDQLYFSRPIPKYSNYKTPIKNLYLCGSGAHPGGGVTGSPGRLAVKEALGDSKKFLGIF
ncbi:hypothetical protein WR25_01371 isoform A [Diploscapter pachys]|uniref:Pyridine nucleotide-disulfide oxidoreductase domain-containing protein 2 n=1 Tax=Diploscapter pachys TaxID=2018661 RepID=A0A2A2KV18_9BILA|nr:hypothetical protein WR25_01371 isoform A [Diploscapter pachys]